MGWSTDLQRVGDEERPGELEQGGRADPAALLMAGMNLADVIQVYCTGGLLGGETAQRRVLDDEVGGPEGPVYSSDRHAAATALTTRESWPSQSQESSIMPSKCISELTTLSNGEKE